MGHVTVLKTNCAHIDEDKLIKWLDRKSEKWWNKYGLSKTGNPEQGRDFDVSDIKSLVSEFIEEFNRTKTFNNGGCSGGALRALCDMMEEYLKKEHNAKDELFEEVYTETDITIVRNIVRK